jgi:hypothetical protein
LVMAVDSLTVSRRKVLARIWIVYVLRPGIFIDMHDSKHQPFLLQCHAIFQSDTSLELHMGTNIPQAKNGRLCSCPSQTQWSNVKTVAMDFHNTLTAPGLLRCLLLIPQCHSSDSCVTTHTIQLSHLQISVNQSPGNAPLLAIMTTNNTISGPTVDFGTVADRNRFIINLSVRHANTANPRVHVKTTWKLIVYSNDYHPQDHVYQSAVYYEILRYTPHISVTIELGRHCALADRIAMNHTLAGLLTSLDEEADVETLQFRVLDGHRFTTAELVEVLQPVAMWIGEMPNVGVRHFGPLAELHHTIVRARRSHSPSDGSIREFYSVVRMAGRTAWQLREEWGYLGCYRA